jgi:hypothetical protein
MENQSSSWMRPFATALLDGDAIGELATAYSNLDGEPNLADEVQTRFYAEEKPRCIKKYGDNLVNVAYNFDLIFSMYVAQLHGEVRQQKNAIYHKLDIIDGRLDIIDGRQHMLEVEDKCAKMKAELANCEAEMERQVSLYKMVLCEIKTMDTLQWSVIVAQVYICIILIMLVAVWAIIVMNIGCDE